MKIGLVCPYVLSRPGGVGSYVKALQQELKSRGHEAKIIAPIPRDGADEEHTSDPDIILLSESLPVHTPFRTTVDVSYKVDGDEIEQVLARENFDILHFHEPWIPRMPMQVLARSHCTNVATFHAKRPENVLNRGFEKAVSPYAKQIFKDLDCLTAVSDAAAGYVRTLLDGTGRNIQIIPNGINLAEYNRRKIKPLPEYDDDIKTILYVGRLEGRKGAIWLLRAYQQLVERQPNVRLLIASDGPKRQMLEEFVATEDLPNVTFLGFVSEDMKKQLLRSADLFCSPALYGESFGIVLLEAMAMGVVTVCGNNSGYESVMKERGRISLVNPKSTDEFAERLELMLFDDQIRHLWTSWAKDYVKQFDYKVVVDQYEEVYKRALASRCE